MMTTITNKFQEILQKVHTFENILITYDLHTLCVEYYHAVTANIHLLRSIVRSIDPAKEKKIVYMLIQQNRNLLFSTYTK